MSATTQFKPTAEQKAILTHAKNRHARVLAGPGTGKSATLVALVGQLLAGHSPPRLRLLTFTRAATGELARKAPAHPGSAAERPSTIHSFAISVLLRNPGLGGFPRPLRIADDWEQDKIVYTTLAKRIGVRKKRLENLFLELAANWEALAPEDNPRVDPTDRDRFSRGWQEHRNVFGYTLLAELPYALMCALQAHPHLQGVQYDLLVVDEYQDLNACDLRVLKLIADQGCSIIGAGDDDQSIYSFRRAAPEGIRRFPTDYPGCSDYSLSVTHRCGSKIMDWATSVIEGDPDRPQGKPRLKCAPGSPRGEVALLAFRGGTSEARGVARIVDNLINKEEVKAEDILVLLRSDHQGMFSGPVKAALSELGISCSDPGLLKQIFGEVDNRRVLAALRLLVHRSDSLAWASLLKLRTGIGDGFLDHIYELAKASKKQFGEELLQGRKDTFSGTPSASARRACELVDAVIKWLDDHPVPEEVTDHWGQWILDVAGKEPVPQPSDQLADILCSIDKLVEPEQGLGRYLGQIAPLAKDLTQTESQGVRIMTMCASKGLTVGATIVAGLEHELIPWPDADQAEERRLLYVAMTRAKRFLFGTWARRRQGPTARAGNATPGRIRNPSMFVLGGPVRSEEGEGYLRCRWP